jgi:4-hydroxymandelate oxidase
MPEIALPIQGESVNISSSENSSDKPQNDTSMIQPLNLREYEQRARELLPQPTYDYYAGGAGDEITIRENEQAWAGLRLRPRVFVDVSACETATTVLGQSVAMPILTAPCALNALAHPDGELAVARATANAGMIQVLSTLSSYSIEEVALSAPSGGRWFQLYCCRDRGLTRALVERAEGAGFGALCVTVDSPMQGRRERDIRNGFKAPAHIRAANFAQAFPGITEGSALLAYMAAQLDPSLSWEALGWLRSITRLPIVVKGILTAEDALLAVQHGAAGIIVSNHGGRQLDSVVSTAEALPEIVAAVQDQAEVYVDGGIRRGTDVLKALALGARAVLIGRPYLWALTVNGEAGVAHVLTHLHDDLKLSMALAGCPKLRDIGPRCIASRR